MPETTQYVACAFRRGDGRSYTYANTGDRVKVGDEVKVPDKSGEGWQRVYVTAIEVQKPTQFESKPILGLAPPKDEPQPEVQQDFLDANDVDEDVQSLIDRDRE